MDILEKIEMFLGEEISGTPAPSGDSGGSNSVGTTTSKVAKYEKRSNIINRKKKKSDDEDSEQEARGKEKIVKSGMAAINGLGAKTGTTASTGSKRGA